MTRHFLTVGAQERFSQARFDSIRTMGRAAKEENCQFMLVCGDAFESNQVDRRTVARALEALKDVPVPVFILPGNHDPLNAASVYRSSTFIERKSPQVQVIESAEPIRLADGVELVGAPWVSKRPPANPIEDMLRGMDPADGSIRICAAHGGIDYFTPDKESPGIIQVSLLETRDCGRQNPLCGFGRSSFLDRNRQYRQDLVFRDARINRFQGNTVGICPDSGNGRNKCCR